mmetsp:Transcript_5221/g.14645  ORF Transcript_5221/g.14645 Transcript_5221/m.14645 type:complete len:495 (+) Transcript_5221:121-1605(+)
MPPSKSTTTAARKLWFVWVASAIAVLVALIGSSRIAGTFDRTENSKMLKDILYSEGDTTKHKAAVVQSSTSVPDSPFNYTAFWENVRQQVRPELLERQINHKLETCPKVFVYDLTQDLRDGEKSLNFTRAFGIPVGNFSKGNLFQTGQYNLGRIVEYRIMASKYCITTNPDEADLFYVPVFPDGRSVQQWQRSCGKKATSVKKKLLKQLVHLNNETACKHFFIVSKSFEAADSCAFWWSRPIKEFAPAMRVSYTELHYGLRGMKRVKNKFYKLRKDMLDYPNRISVPYPSSLHWKNGQKALWAPEDEHPRTIFSLFVGRLNHGDLSVREEILHQCQDIYKNDLSKCKLNLQTLNGKSKSTYIEKKLNTTFCLEPGGDTPDRKSISDSIASGCIPVFFNNVTGTGWGLFWGEWKAQAHVVVPREEWIRQEIDLYTLLHTTMPPDLLRIMQQTLRTYARQFQYSIDEDSNDGIRVLLEGMKRHSQERMTDGKCNPV